jgi:hypothetical protein
MARMQIGTAISMFFVVWLQVIVAVVHLWRAGDHWTSGYTLIATSVFSILGVAALTLARQNLRQKEPLHEA